MEIYIANLDYTELEGGEDVVAFRYIDKDGCRHTS